MLENATLIGFIPVSDLAAAAHFYSKTLGLEVQEKNAFSVVLAAPGGASIRCVQAPPFKPQPFTILGWEVADIHKTAADLKAAGVSPILYPHFEQDAQGIWLAPGGVSILWFNDPDGNILSLSQHKH